MNRPVLRFALTCVWLVAACLIVVPPASVAKDEPGPSAPASLADLAELLAGIIGVPPRHPDTDPFYKYDGPLRKIAPGTILDTRPVVLPFTRLLPRWVKSWQVLYRTTGQLGQPKLAVATVMQPADHRAGKLVSYQTFYDGLGAKCLPSYTLRGGDLTNVPSLLESTFIAPYLTAGYTVVTADYETVTSDYTTGRESGLATLDGIRAAQSLLDMESNARVAMLGYSGGSIASEYAAELAPSYAREVNLVGTAAGGVPVHVGRVLKRIAGIPDWAGVPSYLFAGLARGYEVNLDRYLTDTGRAAIASVQDTCLDPKAPAVGLDQMFKRPYREIRKLRTMVRDQRMGRAGTPREPLFLATGNVDGTGDGIMLRADLRKLADRYCGKGVAVKYREYTGADHNVAGVLFNVEALGFVTRVLERRGVPDDCPERSKS